MALWGGASERALRWSMLIAAITSLGALRFCAMAIMALSSVGPFARRRWIPAGASIIAIEALTVHDFAVLWLPFEIAATVLGIAAGILMADWRRTDLRPDRWIDLPAAGAFVAALLIFAWIREIWSASAWTRAWVFPCYLVALMTVWILRRISRPSPGPA